jgi:hypothetical protein
MSNNIPLSADPLPVIPHGFGANFVQGPEGPRS